MVSSIYESCVFVNSQLNVKPLCHHVRINLISSPPFSVINPMSVRLNNLMDNLLQNHCFCFSLFFHMIMLNKIIGEEKHVYFFFQQLIISSFFYILIYASNEPPTCVSAVVSWMFSAIQKVWNHSVTHCRRKL